MQRWLTRAKRCWLSDRIRSPGACEKVLNLSQTGDLHEAAANLFAMLRTLDAGGYRGIAVMSIPYVGLGIAINDRLQRAAAPADDGAEGGEHG